MDPSGFNARTCPSTKQHITANGEVENHIGIRRKYFYDMLDAITDS